MIDRIDAIYVKNKIELSWLIKPGTFFDEN